MRAMAYSSDEEGFFSSDEENEEPHSKRKCIYSSDEESFYYTSKVTSIKDPTKRTQRGEEFYCDKEFFSGVSRDNFETEHDEENNHEEPASPALSEKLLRNADLRIARKRKKRNGGCLEKKETCKDTINEVKSVRCCEKHCLGKIGSKTIQEAREFFYKQKRDDQSEFIFSSLRCCYAHSDDKNSKVSFVAYGTRMCEVGWKALYGIKDRRYRIIKAKVREGCQSLDAADARGGQSYPSEMYLQAKTFIERKSVRYGDPQPDCREIHLPCCVNKTTAYDDYKQEFLRNGIRCLSKRSFYRIWQEHFSNVKVRKFQKFSKCNECTTFRDALTQKLTKEERIRLQHQRQIHLKIQELSREKYYKHRAKSRDNPDKYISIIIDNMDQSKTNLPRFTENFKSETGLAHIHHHLTGVLSHGTKKSYVYTWTDLFSSDCNVTLNCLMLVLKDVATTNNGSLPPVLYLQADNSAKDNKNKFVIIFLAMLVKADILKKIKLTFLMVGHTHEDIDQMFSCISKEAQTRKLITIPDLQDMVRASFTPKPDAEHLESLWDFRGMAAIGECLRGIKDPHVFKLTKKSGRVILSYKDWPLSGENYREVDLDSLVPDLSTPVTLKPNLEKVRSSVEEMKKDLQRWEESGRFRTEERQWWERYLTNMMREKDDCPVPLAPSTLPKYRSPPNTGPQLDRNIDNAIERHMLRLQKTSTINITGRRNQHRN